MPSSLQGEFPPPGRGPCLLSLQSAASSACPRVLQESREPLAGKRPRPHLPQWPARSHPRSHPQQSPPPSSPRTVCVSWPQFRGVAGEPLTAPRVAAPCRTRKSESLGQPGLSWPRRTILCRARQKHKQPTGTNTLGVGHPGATAQLPLSVTACLQVQGHYLQVEVRAPAHQDSRKAEVTERAPCLAQVSSIT